MNTESKDQSLGESLRDGLVQGVMDEHLRRHQLRRKEIEPIPREERLARAMTYQADLRRYGSDRYRMCTVRFWSDGVTVSVRHVDGTPNKTLTRWYPALERAIIHLKEDAGFYE